MGNSVYIDGCNVAECIESLTIEGYAENCRITNSCCKHSPNCYFKQLQRAKAENEKLKEMTGVYSARLMGKYKQALEEIREILCYGRTFYDGYFDSDKLSRTDEAIKRVNEVLND